MSKQEISININFRESSWKPEQAIDNSQEKFGGLERFFQLHTKLFFQIDGFNIPKYKVKISSADPLVADEFVSGEYVEPTDIAIIYISRRGSAVIPNFQQFPFQSAKFIPIDEIGGERENLDSELIKALEPYGLHEAMHGLVAHILPVDKAIDKTENKIQKSIDEEKFQENLEKYYHDLNCSRNQSNDEQTARNHNYRWMAYILNMLQTGKEQYAYQSWRNGVGECLAFAIEYKLNPRNDPRNYSPYLNKHYVIGKSNLMLPNTSHFEKIQGFAKSIKFPLTDDHLPQIKMLFDHNQFQKDWQALCSISP